MSRRRLLALGAAVAAFPLIGADAASAQAEVIEVAPGFLINRRIAWAGAANPAKAAVPEEEVRFLLVHHTAGANEYAAEEVPQLLRGIYGFHTGPEKGWPDIAYNFMIDRYGGVWETHEGAIEQSLQGYATGGNQGYSALVCLLGNFETAFPTEAAIDSLVNTLSWLAEKNGIDTALGAETSFVSRGSNLWAPGVEVTTPTINGHRSMSQTTCPGEAFFPFVRDELPAWVSLQRQNSSATTVPDTESSISSTSPAVEAPTSEQSVTTAAMAESPTTSSVTSTTTTQAPSSSSTAATSVARDADRAAASPSPVDGDQGLDIGLIGLATAGVAAAVGGVVALRTRAFDRS